jgi:hypothetical protein
MFRNAQIHSTQLEAAPGILRQMSDNGMIEGVVALHFERFPGATTIVFEPASIRNISL